MASRIVTVFGATGTQGASVVNAILKDGAFTPRAITRNPTSEAALKLAEGEPRGQSITNYFEPSIFPGNPTGEIEQGKNLIDAAKEAGVKFFVFSSLPSMSRISAGKYTQARHFDNKEAIDAYLRSSGMANASIQLGGFFENFWMWVWLHLGATQSSKSISFNLLKKTDTGYNIAIQKFDRAAVHNWTWVTRDVRTSVLALLKNYDDPAKKVSGKVYPVITICITYPALAEMVGKTLEVEVTFSTPETSGMKELDEMFACQSEFASEFFKGIPIPNPELVELGAEFSSIDEFMETEVKSRYAHIL
ncbi:hypothetical protein DFH07DRAFT_776695 [Mycena maculata]|uniref:NmrA-like domain-containing protein n=1 Tax=Mycena maculata TaxID=230809 RepID=A0AAD7IL44_9AGAR|nr:hypothetical protein DFH07DRAFT_776695 [Mycena maculata]